MNYRHSFHAGNFADLVKHALVLWLLERRQASGSVTVIDTHAGAGLYDLTGDATRSREAEAGIARLMATDGRPPLIEALAAEVAAMNPDDGVTYYPGSPLLMAHHLGPQDRYLGFELHPPVLDLLEQALKPFAQADARGGDGFDQAVAEAKRTPGPLVLIDPPYEAQLDEFDTALAAIRDALARWPQGMLALWYPIKLRRALQQFYRKAAALDAKSALLLELLVRPDDSPLRMNGSGMLLLNAPWQFDLAMAPALDAIRDALGEAGASSRLEWLKAPV